MSTFINENYLLVFFLDNSGYLINTPDCRIPEMYLKVPQIDEHMDNSFFINCKSKWNYTLPLVVSNLTALTLNTSAWVTLNITKGDPTFKCHYTPIGRFDIKDCQERTELCNDNIVK